MRKKYIKEYHNPTAVVIKKIARVLLFGSLFSFIVGSLLSGFPIFAFILNITFPSTSIRLSEILSTPINTEHLEVKNEYKLPEQDLSLSLLPGVKISKIGVETEILEQPLEQYEEALKQGVWRVPNFGTPLEREKPIILVAHRFGYLNWSQDFREQNSFYNLPELEVGDRIEIVWDQRNFIYEVYQQEEANNISHYDADLILYTCKFWKSDIRIFRYARLIENI